MVKQDQRRIPSADLNQINLPDPVMNEFKRLNEELVMLQHRCDVLEKAAKEQ